MPDLKIVKQGIEPMEKVCPVFDTAVTADFAYNNPKKQRTCLGPACAWFRGDVVSGCCAVADIAGWLCNGFNAEYKK